MLGEIAGGFTGGGASGAPATSGNHGNINFGNEDNFFKDKNNLKFYILIGIVAIGGIWLIKK